MAIAPPTISAPTSRWGVRVGLNSVNATKPSASEAMPSSRKSGTIGCGLKISRATK